MSEKKKRYTDFQKFYIKLDGQILKNHKFLKCYIDQELFELNKVLIKQYDKIHDYHNTENTNIFIMQNGLQINSSKVLSNAITKQLCKYAKNLLDKSISVAPISKAIGHSNLAITTLYSNIDSEEVASKFRGYL